MLFVFLWFCSSVDLHDLQLLVPVKVHSFMFLIDSFLLFYLLVLEEVFAVKLIFVFHPALLRAEACPAPTMNQPLLMRPWTVFGRYGFFVYSALHQCLCCASARVSVQWELNTEAMLCFMSESAKKITTASSQHWVGISVRGFTTCYAVQSLAFCGFWMVFCLGAVFL